MKDVQNNKDEVGCYLIVCSTGYLGSCLFVLYAIVQYPGGKCEVTHQGTWDRFRHRAQERLLHASQMAS
jgi:hypothetical protein